MENNELNKSIVHDPATPVRRVRRPLKVNRELKRKVAEQKMEANRRRKALDAYNKSLINGQPQEATLEVEPIDEEAAAKNIAKLNAEIATESTEKTAKSSKTYIGTKDGKAYAQERHAETLAAKLDLEYSSIKETEDGYVLLVDENQIPEGHTPVEDVKTK